MARAYIGTSGWVHAGWRAHLYADTPVARCAPLGAARRDVHVYFDNDAEGHAVRDAQRLVQLVATARDLSRSR